MYDHIGLRAPGAAHVAFRAADRQAVDRFIDPDGNNVEAVCLK